MLKTVFVLLSISAVAVSSDALILFETGTRELYAEEWTEDFNFCHIDTDWAVGIGEATAASDIAFASILDPSFGSIDDYSVVHLSSPEGSLSASKLGDILLVRDGVAIVRRNGPSTDAVLPGVLFIQPLRLTVLKAPIPVMTSQYDGMEDYIASMVAAVSESTFQADIQHLQNYQTRYSSTDNYDSAAEWVLTTITGFGPTGGLQYFSMGSYNCENVVCELPGTTTPSNIVVICGHLDSTSPSPQTNAPGADDNASGSATVIEAARVMSRYYFDNTIRFICFGGEEQGLYGSEYYAGQAAGAGDNIIAVINLDMILYGPSGQDIFWIPYNTPSTGLALAVDAICDTYVPALNVVTEYSPGTTYSDHASFWNVGYAAILGIEQEVFSNPYYHQTSDILSNYMTYFPFGTDCAKGAIAATAYFAVPRGVVGIEEDEVEPVLNDFEIVGAGPNPASGSFRIDLSRTVDAVDYHVFDMSGRVVLTGGFEQCGASFSIDVSPLGTGVFVLRAASGNASDAVRFTVLK
jgi:hypothetical protein